jgi:D-beta-D-heptose 7-phosphate kinase/D-beta-D-heptose 1-phosphate adenosyltransferase
MRGARILVLGDVMLDEFIWGKVVRISPEAPVPVVEVTDQSFHLGGAGNVAVNVHALGGTAVLAGVVGRDDAGERVRAALARLRVEPALVASDSGRPTTVKTRIIAHQQQVVRADREQADDIADALEDELIRHVARALPSCRALVLSDYQKGVVTPRVAKAVLPLARRRRIPVLVDPKVRHLALYRGAAVVTPNQAEAEQATGIRVRTTADLLAAGRRILAQVRCRAVLITRGEHGMSLFERHRPPVHIPTAAREVFDVTGAGDSVIATLALALCAGARLREEASLANYAAGVVVGKLGTAAATDEEILAAVEAGA